jgi:hypothetical protein
VLTLLVALVVFSVVVPWVSAAIPGQLYRWYVVATVVAILLYVSSTERSWEEFVSPFRDLLLGRTAVTKPLRIAVFVALPVLLGWYFSSWAAGSVQPPGGLRVIHPTPPGSVDVKGKRMVLKEIATNPLRADAEHLAENIAEGRRVYYQNCFFLSWRRLGRQWAFCQGL